MTISGVCEVARKVGPPRNEPDIEVRKGELARGMSEGQSEFVSVGKGPEVYFFTGLAGAVVVFVHFEEPLSLWEPFLIHVSKFKRFDFVGATKPDELGEVGVCVGVGEDFTCLKIILHK